MEAKFFHRLLAIKWMELQCFGKILKNEDFHRKFRVFLAIFTCETALIITPSSKYVLVGKHDKKAFNWSEKAQQYE